VGAFVFWAAYQGLLQWMPNPVIITAITLIVFSAIGRMIIHKAEQESQTPSFCDWVNLICGRDLV
jgi:hypothetical protein